MTLKTRGTYIGQNMIEKGQRFGNVVVVKTDAGRKHGSIVAECKCDCGNTFKRMRSILHERSCCSRQCPVSNAGRPRAISVDNGTKIGKLTVVDNNYSKSKTGTVEVLCECECGKRVRRRLYDLKREEKQVCRVGCERKWSPPKKKA